MAYRTGPISGSFISPIVLKGEVPSYLSMSDLRRLVLDVLKPHDPGLVEMTEKISGLASVDTVNTNLYEVDEQVENVKMTIIGEALDFEQIENKIEKLGGSLHSVDEAVAGEHIIDEVKTPQDY